MTEAARSEVRGNELYAFVASTIAKELKIDEAQLSPTLDLRAIAGIESIKVLRIISKVEQEYDVELEDETVFKANTIQGIVDAVLNAVAGSEK